MLLNKNHVDNTFESPSVISYCTGIRGLERGVERAIGAIRTVAYVEIEAFVIENLLAGMESGILAPAPIWPNIKTFDARPFHGKIHGILGGYPCKPFSIIGKQNGEDHPEHLWPYLGRDIGAIRPVWCGFENVANHINIGYEQVRGELRELGYTVEEGIFSSLEVGAPHKRERLFILAMDYAQCERLQGQPWYGSIQERWKNKSGSTASTDIFPRTRGVSQFEWEEPRTVDRKSCMDFSINGYSFIEDMVRAAGNSVMEQTAEVAFTTLINKHIANWTTNGASQRS